MAFNVGMSSKDAFKQLRQLSPRKRVDAVSGAEGVTMLSMLTPTQFAELFPKYYQKLLPDVGGFREAISKMSRQRQDDIDFGLSQGAKSLKEAEQMGSWRRRLGGGEDAGSMTSTGGYSSGGSLKSIIDKAAAKYGIDPRIMYGIVAGESGHGDRYDVNNDPSKSDLSYGPFQMNIFRNDMEGAAFQKATGLSVKDPSTLGAQADWVARRIRDMRSDPTKIHSVWHGYKGNVDWNPTWKAMGAGSTTGAGAVTPGAPGTASGPDFSQHALFKGVNNYKGKCGIGTRTMAGHMFGNNYFFNNTIGSGGSELAGSLSKGNNYFQTSGMFRSGKPVSKDNLTQEYLNSLPIGTVVSSEGGSRGGHVQIKIGPNQWASDTVQSGFYYGNSYGNFVVHQPNEAGLAALAKNGVVQGMPGDVAKTAVTTNEAVQAAQVTAQKTVAPAAAAPTQPEIPQEVPDNQTATVNKPKDEAAKAKTFSINKQEMISAIRQTEEFKKEAGFAAGMVPDDTIWNGFWEDRRTKELMERTGSTRDPNTGNVTIGNYKKFQKEIGMDTSKILTEVASNVPSHAGGGREKVKGPIHMQRLNKERRGDTALVTDARGKKFTVNPQKESMTVNPNTGIMEVKPHKQAEPMDMEKLMAIVRRQESNSFEGNYSADRSLDKLKKGQKKSSASGAYQYTNDTWSDILNKELKMPDLHKKYPRAVNAPKEIQDMITQKRFEMWRSQGHSDHEIILRHFTGNFAGKISAKAQAGNPTPAKYARDIAEHSAEYDKTYKPTAVAQGQTPNAAAKAEPVAKADPGVTDRLKSLVSPLIGPSQSVAAPAPEKARKEDPQPTGSVDFAPPSMLDQNYLQKQQMTPAAPDKRSMMERPQNAVSINPLEMRPAHMQPTPSMARAMDNARGVVSPNYTALTRSRSG